MKSTVIAISAALGILASAPVSANTAATQTAPAAATQAAPTVSEADLSKFAKAHKDVMQLQQKYQKQMQSVKDQDAAKDLQQKAYQEMTKAVEKNGLSTQEYGQIAQQVQKSPDLQKKVMGMQ